MGLCEHKTNLQLQHMLEIKTMEYIQTHTVNHTHIKFQDQMGHNLGRQKETNFFQVMQH